MRLTIKVRETDFVLHPYKKGDCKELESRLRSIATYLPKFIREASKKEFFRIDKDRGCMHIPKGHGLAPILSILENNNIGVKYGVYTNDTYEPADAPFLVMKEGIEPRNDMQRESIDFLLSKGNYTHLKDRSQRLLELATGRGKTFVSIAAAASIGQRTIVFCPIGKVSKQWVESFMDFTDMRPSRIKLVNGTDNLITLGVKKKIKKDVLIISLATASKLATEEPELFRRIMNNIAPGLIIRDEVHKQIMRVVNLDTMTTAPQNFYLSATANRDSDEEDEIFQRIFSRIPKHGLESHFENVFLNFVALVYKIEELGHDKHKKEIFRLGKLFTSVGYSQLFIKKYSEIYYKLLMQVLKKPVEVIQHDPTKKISIFLSSKEEIDEVTKVLQNTFKDIGVTVGRYHSNVSDKEKDITLACNIIVTTSKSLGTGSDVKGIKYQIDMYPPKGKGELIQRSGRPREINDDEVFYICVYNTSIKYFRRALDDARSILGKRCKTYTVVERSIT